MKILSYAGFGVGLIASVIALMLHFVEYPEYKENEEKYEKLLKKDEKLRREWNQSSSVLLENSFSNPEIMERHSELQEDYLNESKILRDQMQAEMKKGEENNRMDYGTYLLFICPLGFLLSIYPAYKKNKFAIAGVVLSLVSFIVGAVEGTHMMS